LAVNQSCTSAARAIYWTPGNNVVSQSPSAYSLPRESNGEVDGCWLPTHITHSISSSHLQLESLSSV